MESDSAQVEKLESDKGNNIDKKSEDKKQDRNRRPKKEQGLEKVLADLANRASLPDLLKKQLTGTILCKIDNHDNDYVFKIGPSIFEINKRADMSQDIKFDSVIKLNRQNFEELVSGDLNPQIAMLSHKVEIDGSMNMAMYFFNMFM